MPPLNLFLRAFFSSKLLAQCNPPSHYILFFPTTEHLLTHREQETQTDWQELVHSEDILASHVIRVPGSIAPLLAGREGPTLRDGKGKAKQFPTLNGRTVVIKDNFIYSNKGFKNLNQAQLVQDVIYYPDQLDAVQWIVIFISRPLVGTPQPLYALPSTKPHAGPSAEKSGSTEWRDIKNFNDLLRNFPAVARYMQPGLEKLFQEFMVGLAEDESKPASSPAEHTSEMSTVSETRPSRSRSESFSSTTTLDPAQSLKSSQAETIEPDTRAHLERLVFKAIDLFGTVDKHQLASLAAETDITSPHIERMLERYVTQHFHTRILFPRICASRMTDDERLESAIKSMTDLDISQVGATVDGSQSERRELNLRLSKGVEAFQNMQNTTSPHEMVDTLLETARAITTATDATTDSSNGTQEKASTVILTNADLLVSMLLIVVVRSPIRQLYARLSYMVGFLFTEDVDTGEIGYALSTFEAVLTYLTTHSTGLRRASQANKGVRRDVRKGFLPGVRKWLEFDSVDRHNEQAANTALPELQETVVSWMKKNGTTSGPAPTSHREDVGSPGDHTEALGHVFPFQRTHSSSNDTRPKLKKRVSLSLDVRSRSSSSAHSIASTSPSAMSRTSTLRSGLSYNVRDETSPERLCSSQDIHGNSLMMLAVESSQLAILDYLLDRSDLFAAHIILDDCNNDGVTLLSTAIRVGDPAIVDLLVDFLMGQTSYDEMQNYLRRQDIMGRTAGHYLFNAPHLISRLAPMLPWDLRDKNGQTPLFALCRSYDHDNYTGMVEMALQAARAKQADGEPLHLDRHADAKSNTLLHIANDHKLVRILLRECDADPNTKNDKQYTPLMVASKFARLDTVRLLFHDTRTDMALREARGFTAVELAKDDEVRNRIDDLVLLTHAPDDDGRVTMIVRSYFVEDGTVRMILKSGASNTKDTIMVTTCRRSLTDFETLSKWLALEHPASWIPALVNFRSPFQLPFRPSRAVLRDTQQRLDLFLKTMLAHPTFSTHEMLWEFFLVPDIDPMQLSQRAHLKAATRVENLRLEFSPIPLDAVSSVELFIDHALDQIRAVHLATKEVLRRINTMRFTSMDLSDAHEVMLGRIEVLGFLPETHVAAMKRHKYAAASMHFAAESSPMTALHYQFANTLNTTAALLSALGRPAIVINKMRHAAEQLARHESAAARSARWPSALGLLDDARRRLLDDNNGKANKAQSELDNLGRELAYTQSTVAAELAGWWEMRAGTAPAVRKTRAAEAKPVKRVEGSVKAGLREFARGMVIRERERLERLRRAGRLIGVDTFKPRRQGASISLGRDVALPTAIPRAGPSTPESPLETPGADADPVSGNLSVDELATNEDGIRDEQAAADAISEAQAQTGRRDSIVGPVQIALFSLANESLLNAEPAEDDEPELTEEAPLVDEEPGHNLDQIGAYDAVKDVRL